VDDGWPYVGMQSTDIGLAPPVNCSVCPATDCADRMEPKMRPAGPHFSLYGRISLGQAESGFRVWTKTQFDLAERNQAR